MPHQLLDHGVGRGGSDNIVVGDLSGTDVTEINIDLAGVPRGNAGDGQVDTITINATSCDNVILVSGDNGGVTIQSLSAQVNITNFDDGDQIIINGLGGDDVVAASGLQAGLQHQQLMDEDETSLRCARSLEFHRSALRGIDMSFGQSSRG
jgi:hypothetical protein